MATKTTSTRRTKTSEPEEELIESANGDTPEAVDSESTETAEAAPSPDGAFPSLPGYWG